MLLSSVEAVNRDRGFPGTAAGDCEEDRRLSGKKLRIIVGRLPLVGLEQGDGLRLTPVSRDPVEGAGPAKDYRVVTAPGRTGKLRGLADDTRRPTLDRYLLDLLTCSESYRLTIRREEQSLCLLGAGQRTSLELIERANVNQWAVVGLSHIGEIGSVG